ncbi:MULTISPECIES: class I SAM-dependent methyltransferase [Marinobacter]|jgi:16S rRNA (guanine1516-N2)-methyltransferase|uniref:class I SAM-dependent methyltransferase n=1 Tax=Marinobacter TaxID=2742 RepID=UPI0007884675|nr:MULTISPECIES: class I SAM-dependent methyltransferase [unclassified Marinobacter]MAK48271.1 SAM-dependent methyltransferase [Marinobacter sp.]MAM50847.1 SAM-dependent methyltransferase [Marinobacter sp.]HAU18450.1 SAM-dependent methyltransferase [Marinobacter adhaerens]HBI79561.1 SAM-dependent methyltransferase [Marinobacter adhaerens]|tara:strand:+ start:2554 stop:3393 length:840 start_codon:yes stop_codon:yes gene_type:complete
MPDSSPSAPYARSERFQNIVAVARSALGDRLQADALADSLGVPNLGVVRPRDIRDFPVLLFLDEQGLGLQMTGKGAPGPVRAEFVTGKMGYRREHGGGAGQLVAKAVGLQKTRAALHIVDATAGLGQDAFVLASLGCTVTLFERNPVIHALLADGLARAALNVDCAAIVERMRLLEGSSIEWLARPGTEAADVVYLDPMFPHRDKSALVKKEMQVFRTIVGDDEDSAQLLAAALERARYRVVVKRPRKASAIEGAEPTTRIEGKSSRYDVYAIRALPPQ